MHSKFVLIVMACAGLLLHAGEAGAQAFPSMSKPDSNAAAGAGGRAPTNLPSGVARQAPAGRLLGSEGLVYVMIGGGYSVPKYDTVDADPSPLLRGGVGVAAGPWRIEFELAHRFSYDISFTSGAVQVDTEGRITSAFTNVYYDLVQDSPVRPYVGLGIGIAHTRLSDVRGSVNGVVVTTQSGTSSTEPAFNLTAGITADAGDAVELDLGYRYFHIIDNSDAEKHHEVLLSSRVKF